MLNDKIKKNQCHEKKAQEKILINSTNEIEIKKIDLLKRELARKTKVK
jgi:hypothetical protein